MLNFELEDAIQPKWISSYKDRINNLHNRWVLKDADIIQQVTYTEIMGYLQSTLLRDCDVMSMAHGLEVRPVLLDHELVEFVYSLPMNFKLKKEQQKKLFIDSLGDIIPCELRNRSKMGFELPSTDWMSGALKEKFVSLFRNKIANQLFTKSFIESQIKILNNGKPTRATWAFGVLIAWLDKYDIELSTN